MKKELHSLLQWTLVGIVISVVLLVVDMNVPIVALIAMSFSYDCELSVLIMHNLIVEVLIFLVLQKKSFAKLPNKYCLSIANVIILVSFIIWYCIGHYYVGGVESLPFANAKTWIEPISEELAALSQYIVWPSIFIVAEGIIAFIIERYTEIKKKNGRIIIACSLLCILGLVNNVEQVESLLVKGPIEVYSKECDTYVKAWLSGKDTLEIEFYREGFNNRAHFRTTDNSATFLLRQDSIAIFPKSKQEPSGDNLEVIKDGDFTIYNGYSDFRSQSEKDKHHTQCYVSFNPLNITIYPYRRRNKIEP